MTDEARVLVVDDEADVRGLLARTLTAAGYECRTAAGVAEAKQLLDEEAFELALSDIQMPGESGFALVHHASRAHPETAVVMVTAFDDQALADQALELGAYGYVVKPFRASELLINVRSALRRRHLELESRSRHETLEATVLERTADLRHARAQTIQRLARLAEFRDDATGKHVHRVSRYSGLLAEAIGGIPRTSELLRVASQLHDVGKVAIPDKILLKPGPLDDEERLVMQRHAEFGYEILSGSGEELLELAAVVAWTHHERFDGSGYPRGLAGEEIPLEGRIVAVADAFDAMTSDRVYQARLPFDEAVARLEAGRGAQFDAAIVDGFIARLQEFALISLEAGGPDDRSRPIASHGRCPGNESTRSA
jgi:putative two-component system response regulator